MTVAPTRVLLCGVGSMGANHLRVLKNLPELCQVVGVVDPSPERHAFAATLSTAPCFTGLAAGIDACQPQAVVVASATVTHHELAGVVIDRKLPLLVEKPIARTAQEGRDLVARARAAHVPLMVGHVERFNPAVVAVKRIVATGELGDMVSFSARRIGGTPRDIDKAGDVLVDLAVHDIDIASWILGPPVLHAAIGHSAPGRKGRVIDSATMLFTHGETTIDIHANWVTPVKIRDLRVTGVRGHLDVNLITQQVSWTKQNPLLTAATTPDFFFDEYLLSFATPDRIEVGIQRQEPLAAELRAFLRALREPDPQRAMPVSGEDGVRALELAEAARHAVESP